MPREATRLLMLGSTDVADVSRVVPLAQFAADYARRAGMPG